MDSHLWRAWAWGEDFVRAVLERPLLCKLLFRIVLGRHAFREFYGLLNQFNYAGASPWFGYGLEGCDYHQDPIPQCWWREHKALAPDGPSNGPVAASPR